MRMLSYKTFGTRGPTLVLLHWLGGSALTWTELATILAARGIRSIAIDLPGFGDSVDNPNYSVEAMADEVLAMLHSLDPAHLDGGWLLGGHSMGGKVAAVLARTLIDTPSQLPAPTGVILVSPSPPSPEPMKDAKREDMLAALGQSTGDPDEDRKRAATFVDDNTGKLALDDAILTRTVNDVLRMSRAAFTAWLTDSSHQAGSKEDWSTYVGVLPTPALIFAGTEDAALGPDAQREHTLPHFRIAQLIPLEATGHLGPIERPTETAEHILTFATSLSLTPIPPTQALIPAFERLLNSVRTSPQTRAVMAGRLNDTPAPPQTFSEAELRTLLALVDAVVPNAPRNIATRLDHNLAQPHADGWRFDDLPADAAAWHQGLASLDAAAHRAHSVTFLALTPTLRHDLLVDAQQGKLGRGALGSLHLGDSAHAFTAAQMKLWFEDVRSELTRLYVSDPRTMDRIGFTGFADDPAAPGDKGGFTQIRLEDQQATPEELEAAR